MKWYLFLFVLLAQGCALAVPNSNPQTSAGVSSDQPKEQQTHPSPEEDQPKRVGNFENSSCASALLLAEKIKETSIISAFRTFNEYPPTSRTKRPDEIAIEQSSANLSALVSCSPAGAFEFTTLTDGILSKGTASQLHPMSAWKLPEGGYLVTYLHKNYEIGDGEGVSIEISGIVLDAAANPVKSFAGLSSWYEYEGSIRIRDLTYTNGSLVTTEEVFDPAERDQVGRIFAYRNDGRKHIIESHQLVQDEKSLNTATSE